MDLKEKKVEPLQAVVVADNFDQRFTVLEGAWCHLPLANRNLIDYTLDFLSRTEIRKILLVVGQQVEVVRKAIECWKCVFESITLVQCRNCQSLGDALRELDSRSLIKCDFLLLSLGTLCTDVLQSAINQYRSIRKSDKNSVMTLVYNEADISHPLRSQSNQYNIMLAAQTGSNRLRLYHQLPHGRTPTQLSLATDLIVDGVTIRSDLNDCQLAICSPQIPALFSDNFDFQSRSDLIKEILTNEEILGHTINIFILPKAAYAACISDFGTYLSVSKHIIQRWTYPLVLDGLVANSAHNLHYSIGRRLIYTPINGHSLKMSKNSKIERNVVIGQHSSISDHVTVRDSAIGSSAIVDEYAVIDDCILWDNVLIGKNCFCHQSIICSEVNVRPNCKIGPRCVIGPKVYLPPDTVVPAGSVLSVNEPIDDEEEILSCREFLPGVYLWLYDDKFENFWPDPDKPAISISESDSSELVKTAISSSVPFDHDLSDDEIDNSKFNEEVLESLKRGIDEELNCENLILEINGSKFAYNQSGEDVVTAVTTALYEICKSKTRSDGPTLIENFKKIILKLKSLLLNYFSSEQYHMCCLAVLEENSMQDEMLVDCLMNVINLLYELDILGEEAILLWHRELEGQEAKIIKPKIDDFIKWLVEAEEEESDSDC